MTAFVIVLHVLVSLLLILTVLLQPGNKGGMGAAFGGAGGATVFGGRGANTFLAKLTAGSAIIFMLTSFTLVYLSSRGTSAFDRPAAESLAPAAAPALPGDAAGEGADAAAPAAGAPEGVAPAAPAPAADVAPKSAPVEAAPSTP